MFKVLSRPVLVLVAVFSLLGAPALSAEPVGSVKQVRGAVLVDRGQGYQPLPNGASVGIGDRLILLEGASAVLVGAAGCVYRLQQNSILQLGEPSVCDTAVTPVAGTYLAQAIGIDTPGEVQSDVPAGGFGAIGADAPRKLTPKEVKQAVDQGTREAAAREAAPLPEAPPVKAAESKPSAGARPAVAKGEDKDKDKTASSVLARTPAPRPLESVPTSGGSVSSGVKIAGLIGGGVAVVAALAGGGGGGDHGAPAPPLSPQ